jgi:vitamin K-dependent gamma-carboxylase
MRRPFLEAAAEPVNGASIAFFRIAFGVFMIIDVGLYLPVLASEYYVDTTFNFAYDPWGLVRPLPGPFSVHLVYVAMGIAGVLITIGLWYRWAAASFFVLATYVFLLDSTFFQNHMYLISLLSFLLIFLPTHRMWSIDARRRPELASTTQPAWLLWFLRFQLGVPYVFGGIAKLNADWLAGEPLRMWLADRTHVEVIGRFFTNEGVVWFANYGSLLLDLTIVGFLLNRRTRTAAFVIATTFHLLNARLFGLFVFPWLMIAATTLFFAPDWPLRFHAWIERRVERDTRPPRPAPASRGAEVPRAVEPGAGQDGVDPAGTEAEVPVTVAAHAAAAGSPLLPPGRSTVQGRADDAAAPATFDGTTTAGSGRRRLAPAAAVIVAVWVAVQVLVPLRHLAIPGDANWTEEGHRFAWHMMLRTKTGSVTFVVDDGERTWSEDPADHLSDKQVARLAGHPERLARFAQHLSELYGGAVVRAETMVALNGRERVPIVDPTVDLASVQVPWWGHADWILPNDEPLRRHR